MKRQTDKEQSPKSRFSVNGENKYRVFINGKLVANIRVDFVKSDKHDR